jgi:hypothetical protein
MRTSRCRTTLAAAEASQDGPHRLGRDRSNSTLRHHRRHISPLPSSSFRARPIHRRVSAIETSCNYEPDSGASWGNHPPSISDTQHQSDAEPMPTGIPWYQPVLGRLSSGCHQRRQTKAADQNLLDRSHRSVGVFGLQGRLLINAWSLFLPPRHRTSMDLRRAGNHCNEE